MIENVQFFQMQQTTRHHNYYQREAGMLSPRKGLGLEARKPGLGLGLVTAGLVLGLGLVGVLASASCNLASRPRQ